MPYEIRTSRGQYCVYPQGSNDSSGCHNTRAEAVDQLQALFASQAMAAIAESFSNKQEIEDEESEEIVELDVTNSDEDEFEEYTIDPAESIWSGNIAFEGEATGDNREFAEGAITWDTVPLPLLWQKSSTDGHGGSVVIGRVDEIDKTDGTVSARGVLLDTAEAKEYKGLLEAGAAGGVSIDGDSAQYSVEELEGGKHKVNFNAIRIRGLTAVAIPAFAGAKIALVPDDSTEFSDSGLPVAEFKQKTRKRRKGYESSVTAAATPVRPPIKWFQNQHLPGPTPLTVLDDGQVFGHLALANTCHIGMPRCTTPPTGGTYGYFHTGSLDTAEGIEVSVGHLTFNTGHASMQDNAYSAASHYDHTGAVAADVVAGEDEHGIWFAGALRPHLTDEDIRTFKAAPLSGDWRRIGARMELVAALSVNTPGFPVPRTNTRTKVLVASGQDETFISTLNQEDYEEIGRQTYKDDLAARVAEFYNMDHDPETGRFHEGEDGPGRKADNMKKAEGVVGKKAPQWMKNMISRKRGAAQKKGEKLLPKDAAQYQKNLIKRRIDKGFDDAGSN